MRHPGQRLPGKIMLRMLESEEQLDRLLSDPYPEDVEFVRGMQGSILVLGAGGKMGPTLVRRIVRAQREAGVEHRVFAVSSFSDAVLKKKLVSWGAVTIALDLLAQTDLLAALPNCPYVIYMVGAKFGTTGREERTWATNAYLPGRVAERFPDSSIVAFSTGNVYPLVPVSSGGAREEDPPSPPGEYAQSCLGRERVLTYFSTQNSTPMCFLRLNYAVELRYGILLDIARKVYSGGPIPLAMGYVNVIWQGDANSICLRSFQLCQSPPRILNVTGPETLSVRALAEQFGERFGRKPVWEGEEEETALLNNAEECRRLFGSPRLSCNDLIDLVAHWVKIGGRTLDKPTHFEVRDGKF